MYHKIKRSIFVFLMLSLSLTCSSFEENIYASFYQKSPAFKAENYKKPAKWTDRVYSLDGIQLAYARRMNIIDKFKEVPQPSPQTEQMKKQITTIAKTLHPKISNLMDRYLYGIYFCEELGSTGLSGYIFKEGKPVGGFIILDTNMIDKKANQWITDKEKTAFRSQKLSLSVQIEEKNNNLKENTLRYILLHEFGHVLGVSRNDVPKVMANKRIPFQKPFFKGIWLSERKSVFDDTKYPMRKKIKFYSSHKRNLDTEWQLIYPVIEKQTPFPNLYSSVNADEYYAESFVSYVHCILDKRPWQLEIKKGRKTIYTMENGIKAERGKKIREFFRKALEL